MLLLTVQEKDLTSTQQPGRAQQFEPVFVLQQGRFHLKFVPSSSGCLQLGRASPLLEPWHT